MQVTETRSSGKVKVIEFMEKQGQYHYSIYHEKVLDFYFDSFIISEIIMNLIIVLLSNNRSKFDKLTEDLSRIWNDDTKKDILVEP